MSADFLSHKSEADQHDYCLIEELFSHLDGLWGPHSVDSFALAASKQPLLPQIRRRTRDASASTASILQRSGHAC